MQRTTPYHEYVHHMNFLMAAHNRIQNSSSSSAVKPQAFKTICKLAKTGCKSIYKRSRDLLPRYKEIMAGTDANEKKRYMKKLNVFCRLISEYSSVLEKEIIPHEDFPTGYQVRPINPHVQFDCAYYIGVLTEATEEVVRYSGI